MSEHESRPLTRRELRLRELAEAAPQGDEQAAVVEPESTEEPSFHIEIPLFDETGRPRSRRELRELREQAEAAARAELQGEADEPEEPEAPEVHEEAQLPEELAESEESELPEELEQLDESEPVDEPEQPDEAAQAEVPEPEELAEEEDSAEEQQPIELEESIEPDAEVESELEAEAETELEAEAEPDLESETEAEAETEAAEEPDAESGEEAERSVDDALAQILAEGELETEPVTNVEVDVAELGLDVSDEATDATPESEPSYSFPDIAPLEENQSVFDDPTVHHMGGGESLPKDGGDFDELINRAVAQEGATSTSNSAALILPNMPESDDLSGPLGATGELFITGSIDLPRSLGETGSHPSLLDAIDADPLDDLGLAETRTPTGSIMTPISASRAVSAKVAPGPLVGEVSKEKSKLPAVLISVGGVLVLGAAGLIVWAAANGIFG